MQVVDKEIALSELKQMSEKMFEALVKAVVDIDKEIMVVDADFHADEEHLLLENGSKQESLWGINIYPDEKGSDRFIVFDSMINLRPSWGNKSRGVEDSKVRERIKEIVNRLVVS